MHNFVYRMIFPDNFYDYLRSNTLVGIKGGVERESFLDIWMVEVDNRVFARSWNKSLRSWFTEFIKTGKGQVKYGNKIMKVEGVKLDAKDEAHKLIDKAYLEKYNQKENVEYANGITQPEYANYTLELFFVEE